MTIPPISSSPLDVVPTLARAPPVGKANFAINFIYKYSFSISMNFIDRTRK